MTYFHNGAINSSLEILSIAAQGLIFIKIWWNYSRSMPFSY